MHTGTHHKHAHTRTHARTHTHMHMITLIQTRERERKKKNKNTWLISYSLLVVGMRAGSALPHHILNQIGIAQQIQICNRTTGDMCQTHTLENEKWNESGEKVAKWILWDCVWTCMCECVRICACVLVCMYVRLSYRRSYLGHWLVACLCVEMYVS